MPKILLERYDMVAVVTINRPEVSNAIDAETGEALSDAFDEIAHDARVRAAILTGAGDKAFCAGMDLKAFVERGGTPNPRTTPRPSFTRAYCPKPVIAAANGAAVAGGFEMLLACDLVIAAEHARFGIPEVKRGLIAAGGGLVRLPQQVPRPIALELATTGDLIDAGRAFAIGIVNKVVPREKLFDESLALAHRICANSPAAVRASKQVIYGSMALTEEAAWAECARMSKEVLSGPDPLEGAQAFVEKRAPVWASP